MKRDCRQPTPATRPGYLYVAVMGTAFIVGVIGLTGVHVARLKLKNASQERDRVSAHELARSGIESALAEFNSNPNWQLDYSVDTEYPSPAVPINGGTFTWRLKDAGSGSLQLDGIGRSGDSVCVQSVNLKIGNNDYLQRAIVCGGDMVVNTASLTLDGAAVCTNGDLNNNGTITGDVEAQSSSASPPTGTLTAPADILPLPDIGTVTEYYVSRGVTFDNAALDDGSGGLLISTVLISPATNPFNIFQPDSEGIYIIDADGKSLVIENCRIVGTLVVLNTQGADVVIRNSMCWEPAYTYYPALIVDGNVRFQYTDALLDEAVLGYNFNQLGTPYQGAQELFGNDDKFPSALAGVFFMSGEMTFDGNASNLIQEMEGVFVAKGRCVIEGTADVRLDFDDAAQLTPPAGFQAGSAVSIVPGSWRQTPSD